MKVESSLWFSRSSPISVGRSESAKHDMYGRLKWQYRPTLSRLGGIIAMTSLMMIIVPQFALGFGPRSGGVTPQIDLLDLAIALLVFVLCTIAGATLFTMVVLSWRQRSSIVAALLGALGGLYLSASWAADLIANPTTPASLVFNRWLLFLSIPAVILGAMVWTVGWLFEKRDEAFRKQKEQQRKPLRPQSDHRTFVQLG
ncbi:MAG: hypothetical protein FJ147_15875 [Deltaproteobacteria bacterium]|nr:hypothetical protein [Deltaproteobacteria bacterium]